ncbi:MAG: FCD domain-containing protein [Actinomycetota bacterium]
MREVISAHESALLLCLRESDGPVGARQLLAAVRLRGVAASESTVARRLRDLDEQGLTVLHPTRGRTLSAAGLERAELVARIDNSATELQQATQIRNAHDVLHLLRARRAIEPEAIADAARVATSHDVQRLRGLIGDHVSQLHSRGPIPRDKALEFHRNITTLTTNPLVQSMLAVVLDPSLDHIEGTLDIILRAHGSDRESVDEHEMMVDAIAEGQGDRAAAIMRTHLTRLCNEVEAFMDRNDPELLHRLLQLRAPVSGREQHPTSR